MSNVILFKEGRIRFCPNINSIVVDPVFMSLEDWVTPAGLLLPVSRAAFDMREMLRDPTFEADTSWEAHSTGILVGKDGRLYDCEFTRYGDNDRLRVSKSLKPTSQKNMWVVSRNNNLVQAGMTMLLFIEDLHEVVDKLDRISPILLDDYEEWDYEALVKHTRAEIERQFPDNPGTAPGG